VNEDLNRDCLVAELAVLRARLTGGDVAAAVEVCERLGPPSALDRVADGFGLSAFERGVLLLAAGPELVAATADEIAAVGGDARPTFGLALSLLPDAHWGALTPAAPLRRWQLVQLLDPRSPTRSPLVVDERVLHHLVGAGGLEPELAAVARPVDVPARLPASLGAAASAVRSGWREGRLVALNGPQHANLGCVAAAAAAADGRQLLVVAAADLPVLPLERDRTLRLMERESVLGACAWAIDVEGAGDVGGLLRALGPIDAPAVVLGGAAVPGSARVDVGRLSVAERRALLGPGPAAAVFDLPLGELEHVLRDERPVWDACRTRARRGFDGLAQVVEPRAGWEDLVLPASQLEQLHALVAAVSHRATVLGDWGFAARTSRGLGTAALFAGPSGTGKTLAAEVVASALALDLVVVDVSQVVSKYIGETEKNLGRVFDAAEDSAAVLLFDEADTLFGKRTEVRDSHDRYANLEVGYLLQRMEAFRGLAILTTNAKGVLDQAFLRRLRAVVTFPYPDAAAREALWRGAFPESVPLSGVDPRRLAAIDLPGGGIAAAALTAAYLGAERGEVTADDVGAATRWELAKNGRSAAR